MSFLNVVYTRFSIININAPKAWKVNQQDIEGWINDVLDNDRLKVRCDIFFNYTLKNIDAATDDNNVVHIVAASSMLPNWVKEKFNEARALYPWLSVFYVGLNDDFSFPELIKKEVKCCARGLGSDLEFASIRLDDDDILSPFYFNYLSRLRSSRDLVGKAFSFPRGYSGIYNTRFCEYTAFSEIWEPKIALGLGLFNKYVYNKDVFLFPGVVPPGGHKKIDQKMDLIVCDEGPCYIRSLHDCNDSYYQRLKNNVRVRVLEEAVSNSIESLESVYINFVFPSE